LWLLRQVFGVDCVGSDDFAGGVVGDGGVVFGGENHHMGVPSDAEVVHFSNCRHAPPPGKEFEMVGFLDTSGRPVERGVKEVD
jgi:hypothetical protein